MAVGGKVKDSMRSARRCLQPRQHGMRATRNEGLPCSYGLVALVRLPSHATPTRPNRSPQLRGAPLRAAGGGRRATLESSHWRL